MANGVATSLIGIHLHGLRDPDGRGKSTALSQAGQVNGSVCFISVTFIIKEM